LTNLTLGDVTIDAMHIDWQVGVATKLREAFLDGNKILQPNAIASPSDFPSPYPFLGVINRVIENDGSPIETLEIRFQNPPTGSGYTFQLHFDIGCQVVASN
jgi:hypothetical protein